MLYEVITSEFYCVRKEVGNNMHQFVRIVIGEYRFFTLAKDNDERNRLWQGRRGAFGAVARLAPNYLVNDSTVPRTKLPQALAKVSEITEKYGCKHGNVFHAGDGNFVITSYSIHYTKLYDGPDHVGCAQVVRKRRTN